MNTPYYDLLLKISDATTPEELTRLRDEIIPAALVNNHEQCDLVAKVALRFTDLNSALENPS